MDYSSGTQTHQQDPNQYPQQHGQEQQKQPYDPSQLQYQAYDHSSQSCYSHYPPQYDQQYHYNSSQGYSNSYIQQPQHQSHQEPTSIYPPGVPISLDSASSAQMDQTHLLDQTHLRNHPNSHYSHAVSDNQQQPDPSGSISASPAALKPVDVAAVSQLAQFEGNAQMAIHPLIGQTPYRGRGRKGNRPFRGGGRGRGRGRGRGGGRHFQLHGAVSTNPNPSSAPSEGVADLMQPPSVSISGQKSLPAPEQVPPPFLRPPHLAWCELCRVDCNTQEILEQHKNGKRHKKNLLAHEELQKLDKDITTQQNEQMSKADNKTDVGNPEKVERSEVNQILSEKLTSEAVINGVRIVADQQDYTMDQSEALTEPERTNRDQFPSRGRGLKRKLREGCGGRSIKTNEGSRKRAETSRQKQVIPLICQLCNVRCESQVVYDSHMAGKKHLANLKRFHGHRSLYGEEGLQALYPPNLNLVSTSINPQLQQGFNNDPQLLLAQLLTYMISQSQAQGFMPPTGSALPLTPAPGPGHAPVPMLMPMLAPTGPMTYGSYFRAPNQLDMQAQGSQLISQDGGQNIASTKSKSHMPTESTGSQLLQAGSTETKTENGTSHLATKEDHFPVDNSVVAPTEISGLDKQVSCKETSTTTNNSC